MNLHKLYLIPNLIFCICVICYTAKSIYNDLTKKKGLKIKVKYRYKYQELNEKSKIIARKEYINKIYPNLASKCCYSHLCEAIDKIEAMGIENSDIQYIYDNINISDVKLKSYNLYFNKDIIKEDIIIDKDGTVYYSESNAVNNKLTNKLKEIVRMFIFNVNSIYNIYTDISFVEDYLISNNIEFLFSGRLYTDLEVYK